MTTLPLDDHRHVSLTAVLYAVLVAGIFQLVFVSGRFAGDLASPLQIMFLRYVGGFLTISAVAILRGETLGMLRSPKPMRHVLRALTGALGGATLIYGNTQIPVMDVTAISLLSPVFLILLGISILGDRLTRPRVAGIAISAVGAGVIVLSRGAFSSADANYFVPVLVVVAGSFLLALESLFIKILSATDRPMVTLAIVNFLGMAILLVPAALTWRSTGWVNLALLGLGPLALFGQYLNIRANVLARVTVLAPLSYTSLVFAALIGWLAFAQVPSPGVVLGATIIVIGGLVLALWGRPGVARKP
jgi:drug/metabolite transporter (DMT)-like permease